MAKPGMGKKPLGIYVHIPFCLSKCPYCDFYSKAGGNDALYKRYVEALVDHMRESAQFCLGYEIGTIYFGGGTPTVLPAKLIRHLMAEMGKLFTLSKNAEVTIEANPATADKRKLAILRRAGFNRLSIGMQSADDNELSAIGRRHSFQNTVDLVTTARKCGFENISLDLMYGLPGQTLSDFEVSLSQAVSLDPSHISCYSLKIEESTPFFTRKAELNLPSDDLQAEMYLFAVDKLTRAGYEHYEISNFAKPGKRSVHNMKYWDCQEYLSFGPSAHSYFGGRRYSYVKDVEKYIDGIKNKDSIIDSMDELRPWELNYEYVMLRLRLSDGLDQSEFHRRFDADFLRYADKLSKYVKSGHATYVRGVWRLTVKGFLVSNTILADVLSADE